VIEANVRGFTDDMNVHRLHNIGTRSIRRQIQRLIYRSGERITPTGSATANEKHCLRAFRPYPQNVATRIPQCGNRSTRGPWRNAGLRRYVMHVSNPSQSRNRTPGGE